jgi:hypothetical protein
MIKPKLVLMLYENVYSQGTTDEVHRLSIYVLHQDEELRQPPRTLFKNPSLHVTTVDYPALYGPDDNNADWEFHLRGSMLARDKRPARFVPKPIAPMDVAYKMIRSAVDQVNLGIGARRRGRELIYRLLI